jgi:hypothetical protein
MKGLLTLSYMAFSLVEFIIYNMNSFDLSRNWFNFSFENPEKISPGHTAIYFFALEHCNRLGDKEKFGFPSQMVMEAIGIKKHQTYIKYFNDLISWGFFKMVQKSQNQYSANIISITYAMPKKDKALDKAFIKHRAKQGQSTGQSIGQSKVYIDKQETNKQETNKQETIEQDSILIFDEFRKLYPGTKRGLETEFAEFKKHKDWNEILPRLKFIIENQIKIREEAKEKKAFIAGWQHLKTFLHQRSWEIELKYTLPESKFNNGSPLDFIKDYQNG